MTNLTLRQQFFPESFPESPTPDYGQIVEDMNDTGNIFMTLTFPKRVIKPVNKPVKKAVKTLSTEEKELETLKRWHRFRHVLPKHWFI